METAYKYNIGDRVVCDGLIGIVESRNIHVSGENGYGLVSEEDEEITCTAMESKIDLCTEDEIDQSEALSSARLNSERIRNTIGRMTDKYFRDGSH